MAIDGVGARTSYIGSTILNVRSQLDDLTQQLASGKKTTTYAGLGIDRGFATSLRTQLSTLAGYSDTATNVNTRIQVANLSLQGISNAAGEAKKAAISSSLTLDSTGQTAGQKTAYSSFTQVVSLLNTQSGGRYLFSGRATDTPSTASADDILNGTGTQAGLKQVIAERKAADLGTSGNGRVNVTQPTASSVALSEDVAGSPFGLKLSTVSSGLTGATVTGPSGSPATISVDLGATNPNDGDKVKFTFTMPDGTSESIELTASTTVPPPAGSFAIGATPDDTAANLSSALGGAIGQLANTSLVAASAMAAADNFFGSPPLRVGSSPFGDATTLVAGTPDNTVSWYTGETGSDPARGTAVARIDDSLTVQYGARADEDAFRTQLQYIAVYAAVTTTPTDPNANAQITALNQRVADSLAGKPGVQSIQDVQADFATAQAAIKSTTARQTQTKNMAQTLLDSIQGVSDDEVATKLMALQTSLSAAYSATSRLYQTSLLNYLPLS